MQADNTKQERLYRRSCENEDLVNSRPCSPGAQIYKSKILLQH